MNNKVIIIGSDHTNTLGVIRSFGENNIKPYLIAISDTKIMGITKSKYLKKYWICKDLEIALLTLISEFGQEKEKPLIVATSDTAVSLLDSNYDRLREKFILPNINNTQGQIIKYMDKYKQYLLATEHNLAMAKSTKVDLLKKDYKISFDIFPCIVKPILSFRGNKKDITICDNNNKLNETLTNFKNKGYNEVIVQELIDFDYECDMTGFCYHNEFSITGYVQKERVWPLKRGSFTFGQMKKITNLKNNIAKIKKILSKINYCGLFDVEFYIKGDKFYLGEINFRNSSSTYLYGRSYICYYWYLTCINNKLIASPELKNDYYVMDEQAEIHNVMEHNITLKQYFQDRKKSTILLTNNKLDKKPARRLFLIKILKNLKLMKFIKLLEKAFHKDNKFYLLSLSRNNLKIINKNNNYQWLEITQDNCQLIANNKKEEKNFKNEFKTNNIFGIALLDNKQVVGRALLKTKGCKDRFIKIKNGNSYLITNVYVNEKYRGSNYQSIIMQELIRRYVNNIKNSIIKAIVYTWNIPSLKNFKKLGFNIECTHVNIRVLKHSINKIKI